MVRIAELRWFLPGAPPPPLVTWFDGHAGGESKRVDRYIRLPGTDALSIKLRADGRRLEFKLRERRDASLDLPAEAAGYAEQWQKWSLPRLPYAVLLPRMGIPGRQWCDVTKRRRMATFAWSPAAGATLTSGSPDCGCRVELAQVEAGGEQWSTLGLEAFGPDAQIHDALAGAAGVLLTAVGAVPALTAEASVGYPGWLDRNEWFRGEVQLPQ